MENYLRHRRVISFPGKGMHGGPVVFSAHEDAFGSDTQSSTNAVIPAVLTVSPTDAQENAANGNFHFGSLPADATEG